MPNPLVVTADNDYTSVESKQAYVEKIKDAKLVVIANSGHMTIIDQYEKFNQVLNDFLSTQ